MSWLRYHLARSQTSPGFYVSAVQVFWKHCGKRRREKAMWKRRNCPFCHFHQIRNCRLQDLSVWKSLKFVVWERVKMATWMYNNTSKLLWQEIVGLRFHLLWKEQGFFLCSHQCAKSFWRGWRISVESSCFLTRIIRWSESSGFHFFSSFHSKLAGKGDIDEFLFYQYLTYFCRNLRQGACNVDRLTDRKTFIRPCGYIGNVNHWHHNCLSVSLYNLTLNLYLKHFLAP